MINILSQLKRKIISKKNLLLILFFIFLSFDLFFLRLVSTWSFFLITTLWLIYLFLFKIKSIYTLLIASAFFCLLIFINFFDNYFLMEKITSWLFIFLLLFLVNCLLVSKNDQKNYFLSLFFAPIFGIQKSFYCL